MADKSFRILPDAEYQALSLEQKKAYLKRAWEAKSVLDRQLADEQRVQSAQYQPKPSPDSKESRK